jgi:hypothetical protein
MPTWPWCGSLRETKPDLHGRSNWRGLAVACRWLKVPLLYAFDGFVIKAHSQAVDHLNIDSRPTDADGYAQRDETLYLCFQRLLRIFRLYFVMRCRGGLAASFRASAK